MQDRQLTPFDRLLAGADRAIKTLTVRSARPVRPNPAGDTPDAALDVREKRHAAGLMRVNHAGEVAAQGLYQGHAAVARNREIETQMQRAADEELDHLAWCEQRLEELGEGPSSLSPVWYAGAFAIGAVSGVLGERWSLGFIAETEKQVCEHLDGHVERLPETDLRSRAIVSRMREDEAGHGEDARAAGAAELPVAIRQLMKLTAKVMTSSAYRF